MTSPPPRTGLPVEEVLPDLRTALGRDTAAVLEAPPGAAGRVTVLVELLSPAPTRKTKRAMDRSR